MICFPPFLRSPSVAALLLGSLLAAPASAEEVLLRYAFVKGSTRSDSPESGVVLHANAFSTGSDNLVGISPTQEQCFVLLRSAGQTIPTSREEAEQSPQAVSFSITPAEGKEVTLRQLTFSIGAASTRLAGRFYVFAKAQAGGSDLELPVAFVRDGVEEGESYPIRKGDQREAMEGRGAVDLSSLPAPLDAPVTFRLYFYLSGVSEADLEKLPEGTNYSIRLDDISLTGEVR